MDARDQTGSLADAGSEFILVEGAIFTGYGIAAQASAD